MSDSQRSLGWFEVFTGTVEQARFHVNAEDVEAAELATKKYLAIEAENGLSIDPSGTKITNELPEEMQTYYDRLAPGLKLVPEIGTFVLLKSYRQDISFVPGDTFGPKQPL